MANISNKQGTDKGGGQRPGAALLVKRRNIKWYFTNEPELRFRWWLRLDLPYVPVSKMSRNFTSVKFSKSTPAWWCIVLK